MKVTPKEAPVRFLLLVSVILAAGCETELYDRLPDADSWTEPGTRPRLPSADTLGPRLLMDTGAVADLVEAFPKSEYTIAKVVGLGQFYIDKPDDMIKARLVEGGTWEKTVSEVILDRIEPHTVALDIGAHIGTHSLLMARAIGPWGRIYAFEPQTKLFIELTHNMRLNGMKNVVPLRYAIGQAPAMIIEMNPAVTGNEGGTAVGQGGDPAELRDIDGFGFKDVSLIKIDVEGYELEVLRGAVATLRSSQPAVIVEIHGAEGTPEERAHFEETRLFLTDLGYQVELVRDTNYLFIMP